MASETVQTTQSEQPGDEKVKTETSDGVEVETQPEVKQEEPVTIDPTSRVGRAEAIIQRNVVWALGAGIVPLPLLDVVAVTGIQIKMLKELSDLYGLSFSTSIAKNIVASLLSGVGSVGLGAIGSSLFKLIPGVGTALGVVTVPIAAGAFTHAMGRVFLMHFESGGTLLDFDARAMRSYFQKEFEKAKEKVARMRADESKTTGVEAP